MKKNIFSGLIYSSIVTSSLLLSACQGLGGLFSDSDGDHRSNTNYSYGNTQHNTTVYQSGSPNQVRNREQKTTTTSSVYSNPDTPTAAATTTTTTTTTPTAAKKPTGTAVPLEAPTVGQ